MLFLVIDIIKWMFVSAAIGVPLIGGLYLLVTPTYKLVENWQNYRLSKTQKPLKDEHFRGLPQRIVWVKVASVFVVLGAGFALLFLITTLLNKPPY